MFHLQLLAFYSSLSNGITEILLNSTEPYLNLCSLFGNDLVQFSYLDRIKGFTMCFSTASLPTPSKNATDFKSLETKKENHFDFESRSYSQEKLIGKTLSFCEGGLES